MFSEGLSEVASCKRKLPRPKLDLASKAHTLHIPHLESTVQKALWVLGDKLKFWINHVTSEF